MPYFVKLIIKRNKIFNIIKLFEFEKHSINLTEKI
jgi:hypothetical protein